MENLKSILKDHPFLKGLQDQYLDLIAGCAMNERFEPGRFLFHEGEQANKFYIVRHGKATVEMFIPGKGPLTIQTLGEGDVLGWSWLIPPYTWHFDARALELTRLISLDAECLRKKCEKDHDLGYEFLVRFAHIMEQRLAATRLQLVDMYGTSA